MSFQTYPPSSQAGKQKSDTQGHLWGSGLNHQNYSLPPKYVSYWQHVWPWGNLKLSLPHSSTDPSTHSTTEADSSCGASYSLGKQWGNDSSYSASPGAPSQPGPSGAVLHPCWTTSFKSTWYVNSGNIVCWGYFYTCDTTRVKLISLCTYHMRSVLRNVVKAYWEISYWTLLHMTK